MGSYRIYFTASVIVETETHYGLHKAQDDIGDAVEKVLPGLDTYDSGPTVLLTAENPYGLASRTELQARL
jgi:hypothetical protein